MEKNKLGLDKKLEEEVLRVWKDVIVRREREDETNFTGEEIEPATYHRIRRHYKGAEHGTFKRSIRRPLSPRYLLILLVAFLLVSAVGATVYAIYITRMREESNDTDSDFFMEGGAYMQSIEEIYLPRTLPKDFYIFPDMPMKDDYSVMTLYQSSDEQIITIQQHTANSFLSVDTEGKYEPLFINDNQTEARYTEKNGESLMIWYDYGYAFQISVTYILEQEELVRIAESFEPVKGE